MLSRAALFVRLHGRATRSSLALIPAGLRYCGLRYCGLGFFGVCFFGLGFCAFSIAGCMTTDGAEDASVVVDARVLDGSAVGDAGFLRDAATEDARSAPALCSTDPCDPRLPGECPTAGSCVLYDAAPACATLPGTVGEGDECAQPSDCAPGLACFAAAGGRGICDSICCPGDDSTCAEDTHCAGSGLLVDSTPTPYGHCLPPRTCDVLEPASVCEPREGCYIVSADGVTDCRVAGTGEAADACAEQADCAPGFFCGGIGVRRCIRLCRLGQPCPDGEGRCAAQAYSPEGTGVCAD